LCHLPNYTPPVWPWRKKLRQNPALRWRQGKGAFYQQKEMDLADAYIYAAEVMVENMLARDAEEGHRRLYRKTASRLA
jgi:enoyl-CoA hydratase/carnithine racemase